MNSVKHIFYFTILGTIITRKCEIIALEDCKVANKVSYCYCSTDLCNGEMIIRANDFTNNDDEDSETEGSGFHKNDLTFSIISLMQPNITSTTPIPNGVLKNNNGVFMTILPWILLFKIYSM